MFLEMARGTDLASVIAMNPKSFLIPAVAVAVLAAVLAVPSSSSGQASGDEAALTALINEVAAQQAILADNQAQIDTKLAAVSENIRLARIYAGRSR